MKIAGEKSIRLALGAICAAVVLLLTGYLYPQYADYGFARELSLQEQQARLEMVSTAQVWLGCTEGSEQHETLIQLYNGHTPLPQGYVMKTEYNWCAAYASVIAIQCENTDIIPVECGCQRQIGLWQELGCWMEDDNYMPLPGDFIYYAWDERFSFGDCSGWADHVGIVAGTAGPFIKVIEGNYDDTVAYRIIPRNYYQIRGYGLPDYSIK